MNLNGGQGLDANGHWKNALSVLYGLGGTITPLVGEYDLNMKVTVDGRTVGVLKVMASDCDPAFVEMQVNALRHLHQTAPSVSVPDVIPTLEGELTSRYADETGAPRLVWFLSMLPGGAWRDLRRRPAGLFGALGHAIGAMDKALQSFAHPGLDRDLKWNLTRSDWIAGHLDLLEPSRRAPVERILRRFEELSPALARLPVQAIHNDLNDDNILVDPDGGVPGFIDFGDMIAAPRVCELAIAGAYAVLDADNPLAALGGLAAGYHAANPLTEEELSLVWPLLKTRLAVSAVNAAMMKRERPGDGYVTVSEAQVWRFLGRHGEQAEETVTARLRLACGMPLSASAARVADWLDRNRGSFADVLGEPLGDAPLVPLSVTETTVPRDPTKLTEDEAATLSAPLAPGETGLGLYGEPRLIYTEQAFRAAPHPASDRRTVHLGVDLFAPPGTPVCAPLAGTVWDAENSGGRLGYGGWVILEHTTENGDRFHTLYGHLSAAVADLKPGQSIAQGETFAALGDVSENGGWDPHLHFQLALGVDGPGRDWPGVADPDDLRYRQALYPSPAALLNLPDEKVQARIPRPEAVRTERQDRFGGNLSITYREPCLLVRGWRTTLYDEMGRAYLDAYNNVPHVGHAHPRIHRVAERQMRAINTNTRYLHPALNAFADKLLSKLPERFTTCYFVNSGSEANELALRLVRAATGARGMIVQDHGYHGNTTGAIDISPYKFDGKGGAGKSDWVEVISVADPYRGRHAGQADCGPLHAAEVDAAVAALAERGEGLAGFIAESFPSVGGQIIPPDGYLREVYRRVRAAGGLCIADEVQTGLGRLGECYWGFEQQGAVPDIVVLGKPLGNGHPIGALVTTAEIAGSFANGMEFFSTFGGSTLSCVVGREVLQIVDDEGLQDNAARSGAALLAGFEELKSRHEVIGDVRGLGLFTGIELVTDRETKTPAPGAADYVKNRLRDHRVLIGTDGPHDSVLKIRPPLPFDTDDAAFLLEKLDSVLGEVTVEISAPPRT